MVICGTESGRALREGDLERELELTDVGVVLLRGLDPEDVGVVYDKSGAKGAGAGEARLVAADGDGEGLCRYGSTVLVKFCAYDCRRSDGDGEEEEGDVLPSTRTGVRPR